MKKYYRLAAAFMVLSLLCCACALAKFVESGNHDVPKAEQKSQTTDGSKDTQIKDGPKETQTDGNEEETEPEPLVQTVTVTAVGDCTLGVTQTHGYEGSFHDYYDTYGENYFFDGVRNYFETDDFTLVNLECVLSESNARVEKEWNLKGRPEYTGIMTGSSVEGCSLGNNHTLDYGQQSLEDTKRVLDEAGIIYAINGHVATYTTASGIVIGIVSSNLLWRDAEHADYIKDGIEMLRTQGADLVIASCHWGIERQHYADDYQKSMAHQIVDWGADLVIGTHPHVLQGVELYNGKVICYSLGNFCFGGNRNPSDKDTAIYRQTFTFVDGQLQAGLEAEMIPCRISSTSARNDFQPTVADEERAAAIIADVNSYSVSGIYLDEGGRLVPSTESE